MLWFFLLACVNTPDAPESFLSKSPDQQIGTTGSGNSEQAEFLPGANVSVDGVAHQADWDDGDTFSYVDAASQKKIKARLSGFNTLESYGPVHRWGDWTGDELYWLAKKAGERAQKGQWRCEVISNNCGYGRICVACPDLQKVLLEEGLAHLFSMDEEADEAMQAVQQKAQEAGAGMWAKGVPTQLVTSLHSLDEREGQTQTYNRLISTKTGLSTKLKHAETFEACSWVCPTDSCMLYVPYSSRYGENQAECLQVKAP